MASLRVSGDPIESAEKRIDITLRLWGGLAAKDLNGYERLMILKYNWSVILFNYFQYFLFLLVNRRGTVIFTLFNTPLRLWETFFFVIWRRLRGLWVHSTSYFNCEFSQILRTVVLKLTLNKPNQHTMIEADRRYVWFIDAVDLRALRFFLSIFALLLRDALQHFTVHSDLASSLSLSNLRTFFLVCTLSHNAIEKKIVGKILFSTRYNCPIWGWRAEGEKTTARLLLLACWQRNIVKLVLALCVYGLNWIKLDRAEKRTTAEVQKKEGE